MQDQYKISKDVSTAIKGIAILFVIMDHIGLLKSGSWGVAVFLFLSGYGLHESYMKNGLEKFWSKRFLTVYVPYIVIVIIEMVIDICFLKRVYSIQTIVYAIFGNGQAVDGTLWYIFYLILFYLAFWIIYRIVKKDSYLAILILTTFGFTIAILWVVGIYHTPVWSGIYFWLFPAGCLISKLSSESIIYGRLCTKLHELRWLHLVFSILWIVILIISTYISGIIGTIASAYWFAIGVVLFAILYPKKSINNKLLISFGGLSYYVYLVEGVFLTKYDFSFRLVENRVISLVIYFVVCVVSAILLKTIISHLLNKLRQVGARNIYKA